MSYFLLPEIRQKIHPENIKLDFDNKYVIKKINNSISFFLQQMKSQISNYSQWDDFKKSTNPYEYIHTHIRGRGHGVSKIKPISRSFFKMVELYNIFEFTFKKKKSIKTFHLAEGPGGFIEAMCFLRQNPIDQYYGITLINEDNTNIPGWRKSASFLKKNPQVIIERGEDGTGNLFHVKNFIYCIKKYEYSMDFITADGGFDFSNNYDMQEQSAFRLILTQVAYALCLQKQGGSFILKVFDIFYSSTIDIVYLLSSFYKKVFIVKPNTSRRANSEKYIICQSLKKITMRNIIDKFISIFHVLEKINFEKLHIQRLLNCSIEYRYITRIIEINSILGQQQIATISSTLKFIEEKDYEIIKKCKKKNMKKCIEWCLKHNIPHYQLTDSFFFSRSGLKQYNRVQYI